jgi:hypothetical protein
MNVQSTIGLRASVYLVMPLLSHAATIIEQMTQLHPLTSPQAEMK